jgi:nicotinate-nucleotide adenylyltransferase
VSALHINYGGTFDPVHCGHLEVARSAAEQLGDVVHLVPAGDPWHRKPPQLDGPRRALLLDLAIAGDARLAIDRREVRRPGGTYTVDTLRELRAELGEAHPIAALVGADAFRHLATWREWRALPGLAHIVVLTRPGHDLEALSVELASELDGHWSASVDALRSAPAGRVLALQVPSWPISSTAVRAALACGRPVREWLPGAVADYIAEHGLYRP